MLNGGHAIARDLMDHLSDLFPRTVAVPFGLFTDIDGTISEIVAVPEAATVTPGCRSALESLARRLAVVAVITGRDVHSARRMVEVEGAVYVGNHGLERWHQGEFRVTPEAVPYEDRVAEAVEQLRQRLNLPGVQVEDTGVGVTVHYRAAENWEHARSVILSTVQELGIGEWLEIRPGKAMLSLRLPIGVDKGTAISDLVREYRLGGAIVLGDDRTDVDGFRAVGRLAEEGDFLGVSVAVVGGETPEEVEREAVYCLKGVKEVEEFLGKLSEFLEGT